MAAGNYESSRTPSDLIGDGFQAMFIGASQKVTTGATSAVSGVITKSLVRLTATADCFVKVGPGTPVATTDGTSMFLPSGAVEYFGIAEGEKIAAIQSTAAGVLYITVGA